MKKILLISLFILPIMFISGCGMTDGELRQEKQLFIDEAQKCVNEGGSPLFYTKSDGWGNTFYSLDCITKDIK